MPRTLLHIEKTIQALILGWVSGSIQIDFEFNNQRRILR